MIHGVGRDAARIASLAHARLGQASRLPEGTSAPDRAPRKVATAS
jgi:hypothetical protein